MTEIVPLSVRGLPRVSTRDAAAARTATRLLARLPRRVETTLAGFGTVGLVCEGVGVPADSGEAVVFGLARGRGTGRLALDAALAHRIVALALGGPARPPVVGRLRLGERGIVAGFIASFLHALDAPLAVSLAAPGGSLAAPGGSLAGPGGDRDASGVVTLALEVTVASAVGWASVELPAAWLAGPWADAARFGALPVEARLELARTWLAAGELAGLGPGDAVVFDGEPSFEPATGLPHSARVVVGAHAAPARLAHDGRATLEGDFRRVVASGADDSREEMLMEGRESDTQASGGTSDRTSGGTNDRTSGGTANATEVLAAAPIEVVAELGRITLRGDEVVGLGRGSVLTFGPMGAPVVSLRVGDEVWAEGELVDVDGALGVRVTATVRAGLPPR